MTDIGAALRRARWRVHATTAAVALLALAAVSGLVLALGWWPLVVLALTLLWSLVHYLQDASAELRAVRAVPADPVRHAELIADVAQLSAAAGLPVPRIYVSQLPEMNAFAVRTLRGASVLFSEELLEAMEPDELRGVIAHELGHVKHRDSGFSLLFNAVVSSISVTLALVGVLLVFGAALAARRRADAQLGVMLSAVLTWVGGLVAKLLLLAAVRQRELLADLESAELTGTPLALARALHRLEEGRADPALTSGFVRPSVANRCVVSPLRTGGLATLLSSHPSTATRSRRLAQLVSDDVRRADDEAQRLLRWQRERSRLEDRLHLLSTARPDPIPEPAPFPALRREQMWGSVPATLVLHRTRAGASSFVRDARGVLMVTTERLVLLSAAKCLEWRWSAVTGAQWCRDGNGVAWLQLTVSNRQKPSGVSVAPRDELAARALVDVAWNKRAGARPALVAAAREALADHDDRRPQVVCAAPEPAGSTHTRGQHP